MPHTIPDLIAQFEQSMYPSTVKKLKEIDQNMLIEGLETHIKTCPLLADAILHLIIQNSKTQLPSASVRCKGFMNDGMARPSICGVVTGILYNQETNTVVINPSTNGDCVKHEALY